MSDSLSQNFQEKVHGEPSETDLEIGRRLRRRRRLLGLTQQELGAKIGVRFQQIQKYECGANKVSAARLTQLANALGVDLNHFSTSMAPKLNIDLPDELVSLALNWNKLPKTQKKTMTGFINMMLHGIKEPEPTI